MRRELSLALPAILAIASCAITKFTPEGRIVALPRKPTNAVMHCLLALVLLASTAAIADDSTRILEALRKANEGLPMFRNPEKVGDYVVVNLHDKTYGTPLGGAAITKDKATGATLSIIYDLINDFKECRERVWTNAKTDAGVAKPTFSTNGLAKAKAAAKERCETFVSP